MNANKTPYPVYLLHPEDGFFELVDYTHNLWIIHSDFGDYRRVIITGLMANELLLKYKNIIISKGNKYRRATIRQDMNDLITKVKQWQNQIS